VEGAALEDGRTLRTWDTFVLANTDYYNGATGDIACDEYHKYKEDVQHMVDIGLEAYRFSISWSRLIPNGRGPVNPKGLDYYNNLMDELIMHGIQPHVTLYRIDTPQALEDEYEGWLSRDMVRDFTAYADVCFKEFGDRVLHWTTVNEANVFSIGGYDNALTPPGRCSPPFGLVCPKGNFSTEPYIAAHNLLLAHSSVVQLYDKKYKATEDVNAAQRAIDFYIGWILHPLVFGDYPDIIKKNAGTRLPVLTSPESKLVKGSFDFIGLNHYATFYIKDNPSSLKMETRDVNADMAASFMCLQTARDGTPNDTGRVKCIHAYIGTFLDALRDGVSNTKGYFLWSFLDGFEVLGGYENAFGLVYVDLNDKQLRRYPKLSAHWYSHFLKGRSIRTNEITNEITEVVNETSVSSKSHASE
ncbi:hypothetical protein ACH5RR_035157, partial [Cinchona calisaya]